MAKMIDLTEEKREKAFLVYFFNKESERELCEMKELIRSALLDFVGSECVLLREANAYSYIGSGKLEEIKEKINALGVDVVVFDHSLTGSQLRNIQNELEVKVIDRTMLILDIFASRAITKDGKLQVELAQLEYSKSRLSAINNNNNRDSEGKGLGERKTELDKRKVEAEIFKKRKELKEVNEKYQLTKKQRKKNEYLVSLIGYSNAGKSTLMNVMAKTNTYADDRLFATLDVLTKKVWDDGVQYVLSDTVGFISNLPHELINAFSSTLEEVRDADVLLIVLDASDNHKYDQLKVVEEEMKKQNVDINKAILVYNKVDKISKEERENLLKFDYDVVYTEARNNIGILELKNKIKERLK